MQGPGARAEWDTSLALVMAFVDGFTGGADAEDLIGDVETRSIGGGKGESRFDMVLPETVPEDVTITESQDWIAWKVEAGEWRLTDCEGALGGSSGNGGSDGDTGFDSGDDPSSVDFDGAPTEIEIALDDMFETPTSGTASVHLLETEDVESPIVSDSYSDQSATGKFVAVRYEVVNDTDAALHQFFDVVTAFDATDGETWFEITDGAASDALSIAREGEDSTADVEPGESATAWLVFDVPADAEVVGLGYRPGFFEVTAVALP
ncbi:MAG: DUF4352 domain-containing protein [Acidimicrobiia bacterium]|nr:DUF4352 domain-containing protein [Acidimicrobiia bacterium]